MAKVPQDSRGIHHAGIVVKVFPLVSGEAGMRTSYEFIAPVLIKIKDRPCSERIQIMGIPMNVLSEECDGAGDIYLDVENRGNTLC